MRSPSSCLLPAVHWLSLPPPSDGSGSLLFVHVEVCCFVCEQVEKEVLCAYSTKKRKVQGNPHWQFSNQRSLKTVKPLPGTSDTPPQIYTKGTGLENVQFCGTSGRGRGGGKEKKFSTLDERQLGGLAHPSRVPYGVRRGTSSQLVGDLPEGFLASLR